MFGQVNFFMRLASQKVPQALERYQNESTRLLGVLDRHLSSRDYVAAEYSIADIALYPWVAGFRQLLPEAMHNLSGVAQWLERVGARPAVQRGMKVPELQR
jgi:GST-like protein